MFRTILTTSTIFALSLVGCVVNDDAGGNEETTTDEPTTTSPTTTSPTTTSPTTTSPTTSDTDTTVGTDTETTTMDPDSSSSTTEPDPGPFVFDETPFEDYVQVDRIGFPAINTGLNLLGDKDAYNQATPEDDANLMFVSNIVDSLHTLHVGVPGSEVYQVPEDMLSDPILPSEYNTGLDDDIAAALGFNEEQLPLPPPPYCIAPDHPVENADTCDDQGAPFAIPDVVTVDTDDPAGFPNGRRPSDAVIDIIFAVLLLDTEAFGLDTFANIPLNPTANDVEFPADFPYLAPAH